MFVSPEGSQYTLVGPCMLAHFPERMSLSSKTGVSIVEAPCVTKMDSSVEKIFLRTVVSWGRKSLVP